MIEREMIPPLIAFAGCLVILFGVVLYLGTRL